MNSIMNEFKEQSSKGVSELARVSQNVDSLSEKELNASIEGTKLESCDCRSECKFNTGHTHKSSNYGYSG